MGPPGKPGGAPTLQEDSAPPCPARPNMTHLPPLDSSPPVWCRAEAMPLATRRPLRASATGAGRKCLTQVIGALLQPPGGVPSGLRRRKPFTGGKYDIYMPLKCFSKEALSLARSGIEGLDSDDVLKGRSSDVKWKAYLGP